MAPAEVPAVNAHATARGIARFYAGLLGGGELDGIRLLGERTVAAMTSPQSAGRDRLLGQDVTWGLGVGMEDGGWGMGGIGGYDRALAFEASLLAAIDALDQE